MKQSDIIKAYKTIQKYEHEKLPLNTSYALYRIKKQLEDQWNFQVERETTIFEKYKPEIKENGNFIFKTPEDTQNFAKDIQELADMDIDIDIRKSTISFEDNVQMSVEDISALEEFVIFK